MPTEVAQFSGTDPGSARRPTIWECHVRIGPPVAEDAAEVHDLIEACPPLDVNSLYANLIQCTHFSQACAVARADGKVIGWISGHHPPSDNETFFLWQVAVHPNARGSGLPRWMLADILSRPTQSATRCIETSITRANKASWALFQSISAWLNAPMSEELWFDHVQHFGGRNASEFLVKIGPFPVSENFV